MWCQLYLPDGNRRTERKGSKVLKPSVEVYHLSKRWLISPQKSVNVKRRKEKQRYRYARACELNVSMRP